jgi:hypothetical protein
VTPWWWPRLLDSQPIRDALAEQQGADLALIVSEELYKSTVAQRFRGLESERFRQVDVRMAKFSGTAWLYVPGTQPTSRETRPVSADAHVQSWDFLVSYASPQETWAEWIAAELEESGYSVHLELWQAVPGSSDVQRMHDAVRQSLRTLAVLSNDYLSSEQVQAEWQSAWRTDPLGMRRTLIPVRVEPCDPDGLLRGIKYIDLVGLGRDAARSRLTEEVEASLHGRPLNRRRPEFPG